MVKHVVNHAANHITYYTASHTVTTQLQPLVNYI
jgi:hypothetical protein